MSAYDMMNEKKRPVYPTLDEGTYADDVESGIKDAEKKAAEIERQAKRDRDMALIGDMAHLVAQGGAMHGGAWKIGQTQNESAKGNERLRVLREKNAAQTAAFAKERAALREAKRKEENAQKLARYNAELEAYKYNKEQERKDKLDALKEAETASAIERNQAYTNYYNSGGKKTSGGGSSNFLKITMPDSTEKTFSKEKLGDNWINNAYEAAVKAGMPRLMRKKSNGLGGYVEYEDTSLAGRKAAIEAWSAENALKNTVVKPGSKGAIYTNDKKTKGAIY